MFWVNSKIMLLFIIHFKTLDLSEEFDCEIKERALLIKGIIAVVILGIKMKYNIFLKKKKRLIIMTGGVPIAPHLN